MNWNKFIENEKKQQYFTKLNEFVEGEYQQTTIYPRRENIYKAFELTEYEDVKVVILGQDPYHGADQAMGLSFSVPKTTKIPPSLVNIRKEIAKDFDLAYDHGDLSYLAKQGVLLLNTVLTVREAVAASHRKQGWETFTDNAIKQLNESSNPIVFMLWGNDAKKKRELITNPNHLVLTTSHPSPLGAYRGFNGCGHFKKANEYLIENNISPINWGK